MTPLTLDEVAQAVGGVIEVGDPEMRIRRVAPLDEAGPEDLSFVASARYAGYIPETRAGALLVADAIAASTDVPAGVAVLRVRDPHAALARLLPRMSPDVPPAVGVHPTAVLEPGVALGRDVSVGAFAVVAAGTRLLDRCRIGPQARIGARCIVGEEAVVHGGATLYDGVRIGARCIIHSGARLGADGFGFVFEGGAHRKVPQIGGVVLGDDVEVGANSTIDRGSIGDTTVGDGTKIDNLVHIGHNCRIGKHVVIVAQVGISGSTHVGDGAVLGGQAGFGGHLRIGTGSRVGAQAGVTADVPDGEAVSGYPARPHREALRAQAALFRLPALLKRVAALERALGAAKRESPEPTP